MYHFLNWELLPPLVDLLDGTQGNEVIELSIQDIDRSRPAYIYSIPIVQAGQSFVLVRTNLLYPIDPNVIYPKALVVSVRIVRGIEKRIIYRNEFFLSPEYFLGGKICRIPIYRVWYPEDYVNYILSNMLMVRLP